MSKLFKRLRHIERMAYKDVPYMMQMQTIHNMSDLADYCECSVNQVKLLVGDNYYLIIADHGDTCEIVDFASIGKVGPQMFRIVSWIKNICGNKTIEVDARDTTSYRLIKAGEKHSLITILQDEPYEWGDQTMHEMVIKKKETRGH